MERRQAATEGVPARRQSADREGDRRRRPMDLLRIPPTYHRQRRVHRVSSGRREGAARHVRIHPMGERGRRGPSHRPDETAQDVGPGRHRTGEPRPDGAVDAINATHDATFSAINATSAPGFVPEPITTVSAVHATGATVATRHARGAAAVARPCRANPAAGPSADTRDRRFLHRSRSARRSVGSGSCARHSGSNDVDGVGIRGGHLLRTRREPYETNETVHACGLDRRGMAFAVADVPAALAIRRVRARGDRPHRRAVFRVQTGGLLRRVHGRVDHFAGQVHRLRHRIRAR